MQFNVPTISCEQLDERPAGAIDDVKPAGRRLRGRAPSTAGQSPRSSAPTSTTATPQLDQQTNQWVVSLDFKGEGQEKWTALTREAFNNTRPTAC